MKAEGHCGRGDTVIVIVGLPDAAAKELRDWVVTALTNSGFKFPMGRCTINLAPADVMKKLAKCVLLAQWAAMAHT
jgi:magnesium chelatase family protein